MDTADRSLRLRRHWQQLAAAAWLTPARQHLAALILHDHQQAFGRSLAAGIQELFAGEVVVLAHDNSADPRLIYANAAALQLWERRWSEMIGMPSRLTAEAQERTSRAAMLNNALQLSAIEGYSSIRISKSGRRFQIHNARLWTLHGDGGHTCGQAAAFSNWWWL